MRLSAGDRCSPRESCAQQTPPPPRFRPNRHAGTVRPRRGQRPTVLRETNNCASRRQACAARFAIDTHTPVSCALAAATFMRHSTKALPHCAPCFAPKEWCHTTRLVDVIVYRSGHPILRTAENLFKGAVKISWCAKNNPTAVDKCP